MEGAILFPLLLPPWLQLFGLLRYIDKWLSVGQPVHVFLLVYVPVLNKKRKGLKFFPSCFRPHHFPLIEAALASSSPSFLIALGGGRQLCVVVLARRGETLSARVSYFRRLLPSSLSPEILGPNYFPSPSLLLASPRFSLRALHKKIILAKEAYFEGGKHGGRGEEKAGSRRDFLFLAERKAFASSSSIFSVKKGCEKKKEGVSLTNEGPIFHGVRLHCFFSCEV